MPGYILHLTQAELICRILKENGAELNDEWKNVFFLGNLLPDTKIKTEKVTSHFWDPETMVNMAIAPDMERFYQKYQKVISGPLMLGYQTHLKLDTDYVKQFWKQILEFKDADGCSAEKKRDIRWVWLKKRNVQIPVEEFFSSAYYYGDYSKMNAYLLKKYQFPIPQLTKNLYCPITEVDISDLSQVLKELNELANHAHFGEEQNLQVFDLQELEQFISDSAQKEADYILKNGGL